MTLFYRGPDALITHEVFVTRHPTRQLFHVRDLKYLQVVRPSTLESIGASTPVWVCSGGAGSLAVFAMLTGERDIHVPDLPTLGLIAVAVTGVIVGVVRRVRSRRFELWAYYRGRFVCVYECSDRVTFGKVTRATQRVVASLEPGTLL